MSCACFRGAILKGIHDSANGDIWGATRSLAIVLGFATTAAGYSVGTIFPRYYINR